MFYPSIRNKFLEYCPDGESPERRMRGAEAFAQHFAMELGYHINEMGRPVLKDQKIHPDQISLRGLAESLVGYEWVESLGAHTAAGARVGGRVFEAGGGSGVAMVPGQIPNVSAYLGSVSGLLQAAMLETYDQPEYKIDQIFDVIPSRTRQQKLIGMGRIGDQAKRRNPGEAHPFAQFQERYVTTPETQQDALAGAVTYEAVFFDQTQEVLGQMRGIGTELGLRKELDGWAVFAGVSNPYVYNGAAYNTYLTSGNWINDQANQLDDWTDINNAEELGSRMTDQETGNRIGIDYDTMVVSPARQATAEYISGATNVEGRTATTQAVVHSGRNRVKPRKILSSVYLDQVLTATAANNGLALSQANANLYWWLVGTGRTGAFARVENWPLAVEEAAPNDFTMKNHKIVLAVFADQMHIFTVREPRKAIRNKN